VLKNCIFSISITNFCEFPLFMIPKYFSLSKFLGIFTAFCKVLINIHGIWVSKPQNWAKFREICIRFWWNIFFLLNQISKFRGYQKIWNITRSRCLSFRRPKLLQFLPPCVLSISPTPCCCWPPLAPPAVYSPPGTHYWCTGQYTGRENLEQFRMIEC
jgi:hypothetical protein